MTDAPSDDWPPDRRSIETEARTAALERLRSAVSALRYPGHLLTGRKHEGWNEAIETVIAAIETEAAR